jgi:hypothetical protein
MHKCERWVQEHPEHAHKVRCGQSARLVVIVDEMPGYAWWACEDHATEALDRARIIVGRDDKVRV